MGGLGAHRGDRVGGQAVSLVVQSASILSVVHNMCLVVQDSGGEEMGPSSRLYAFLGAVVQDFSSVVHALVCEHRAVVHCVFSFG